ncbi:MAG: hypothetical protein KF802_03420 [Bdellovibrionaceae bacterium]|nr:hypothetical protein [Pseudobdellovibrionaceae bacterium]
MKMLIFVLLSVFVLNASASNALRIIFPDFFAEAPDRATMVLLAEDSCARAALFSLKSKVLGGATTVRIQALKRISQNAQTRIETYFIVAGAAQGSPVKALIETSRHGAQCFAGQPQAASL